MARNAPKGRSLTKILTMTASMLALSGFGLLSSGAAGAAGSNDGKTASPIKHVIIVLGENNSFDHTYATYTPRHDQRIRNLLSAGIVNADGTPGPNFAKARQFQVSPQPLYFIAAPDGSKTAFSTLPPPDLNGVPTKPSDTNPPPFATVAAAAAAEPSLAAQDDALLTTGASGLTATKGPDTRIANVTKLPSGPYQQTGETLPYDAYTEDTIHRFFQMWQQSDCSVAHATRGNPSGCLSDLLPFVTTTFLAPTEEGSGTPMAFFNVNDGDAPFLKELADRFTLADNNHQAVMGGTGANHIMIGTGDVLFFSDGKGNALPPPPIPAVLAGLPPSFPPLSLVANPDPVPGSNNHYKNDVAAALGEYVDCSDTTQPGVPAITTYLGTLPWHPASNCATGHFYAINNFFPGFKADGTPANPLKPKDISDIFFIPPSNVPTIGDALIAKDVSWRFYGGGFNEAVAGKPNQFCPICNPMQYATSIMGNEAVRTEHTKDVVDFYADLAQNALPAVSFIKPSGFVDGHPQSSKLDLFEAFLKNIVDHVQAKPELFADTAIIVTWDESGGFYDSGYIQPLDFFGDGPRVPLLAISPFSRGGRIVHTYYDHVSITKFIERNWHLPKLSERSRDNLPNPRVDDEHPYVPVNSPAIGDLFDLFHFDGDRDDDRDRDDHGHDHDHGDDDHGDL